MLAAVEVVPKGVLLLATPCWGADLLLLQPNR